MSKKRKKKAGENAWFNRIFTRKRANRERKLPLAYIEALSTEIHRTQPTKQIIINSLAGFAETLLTKGYTWCQSDNKFFRTKQERGFNDAWNQERTKIDDLINNKTTV
jgi:N-glycosylase/DNA lyase